MRKITELMAQAFIDGHVRRQGNTETTAAQELRLHGNSIAWIYNRTLYLTLAGYPTPTTRERLNGVLSAASTKYAWCHEAPYFFQRRGVQYIGTGDDYTAITPLSIIKLDLLNGAREWRQLNG